MKTNRPVTFSYRGYPFEGKQVGVFTIPQQDRPIYLDKDYGKLRKHVVYYRQGTTTAVASPDDVARMGTPLAVKKLIEGEQQGSRESVRVSLVWCFEQGLIVAVFNDGEVDMYIKEVALCHQQHADQVLEVPLRVAHDKSVVDGKGSVICAAPGRYNYDLPCPKEVEFVLPRLPGAALKGVTTCSPDEVWLVVTSYGGEVHRVLGEELQMVLQQVMNSDETQKSRRSRAT